MSNLELDGCSSAPDVTLWPKPRVLIAHVEVRQVKGDLLSRAVIAVYLAC